jgi:hypothetical protein
VNSLLRVFTVTGFPILIVLSERYARGKKYRKCNDFRFHGYRLGDASMIGWMRLATMEAIFNLKVLPGCRFLVVI